MTRVSYHQLRRNLRLIWMTCAATTRLFFVTRWSDRGVVMISKDDYEGLMKAVHLLRLAEPLRICPDMGNRQRLACDETTAIRPKPEVLSRPVSASNAFLEILMSSVP